MGATEPVYIGDTLIVEFETAETTTGPSTETMVETEAKNNGLDVANIRTEIDAENNVELLTIALEEAESDPDAVAAFQHDLTLFFRFSHFRKRAVEIDG